MTSNPAEVFGAALRQDLYAFVRKSFDTLHPGNRLVLGWHLRALSCPPGYRGALAVRSPGAEGLRVRRFDLRTDLERIDGGDDVASRFQGETRQ